MYNRERGGGQGDKARYGDQISTVRFNQAANAQSVLVSEKDAEVLGVKLRRQQRVRLTQEVQQEDERREQQVLGE